MNILFLSNFFPPVSRGGYEQWCWEVAEGLRNRGHEVCVLTSTYGQHSMFTSDPPWVSRELQLEMEFAHLSNSIQFFTSRKKREEQNLACLREFLCHHEPDAILIWGMWNLPRSLPALAESLMPGKVVYYIGDYWPFLPSQYENYWNAPARSFMTGVPKSILKQIARFLLDRQTRHELKFENVLFPSDFLRQEFERKGFKMQHAELVYGAINTSPYLEQRKSARQAGKVSILCVGRVVPDKGFHTAIQALAYLSQNQILENVHLTIVGDGEPNYVERLKQIAKLHNLASLITFLPAQPKEAMPALYRSADIFVFPSIWAEPFGRVLVEAMASGVPVVGTRVGGAAEILMDGENALVFTPDDPMSLAEQLKRLIELPSLCERLGRAGRETAVERFDLKRMTTEIESYLQALVGR